VDADKITNLNKIKGTIKDILEKIHTYVHKITTKPTLSDCETWTAQQKEN
jgi:hypothetical protein